MSGKIFLLFSFFFLKCSITGCSAQPTASCPEGVMAWNFRSPEFFSLYVKTETKSNIWRFLMSDNGSILSHSLSIAVEKSIVSRKYFFLLLYWNIFIYVNVNTILYYFPINSNFINSTSVHSQSMLINPPDWRDGAWLSTSTLIILSSCKAGELDTKFVI